MKTRVVALWQSLFDATEPPWRYLGIVLLFDLPVTAALSLALQGFTGGANPAFTGHSLLEVLLVAGVATAFLETMVLSVILELTKLFLRSTLAVAATAAVISAGLHSLAAPAWGLVIAWAFFLQSLCYLTWQSRSWLAAVAMTAVFHALHNLFPTLLLAAERLRASP
ncbi:MAG: hypothetical protein C0518_15360 [Opitutus sp.]|nr:hypothetical protein [Opitutus sp.]